MKGNFMDHTLAIERADLFKRLKALFEFDANGVLPCMATGMSGPIGLPLGYLDLRDVALEGAPVNACLVLSWGTDDKAQLVSRGVSCASKGAPREASNADLRCALAHYEKAVPAFRQDVLDRYATAGEEVPLHMQKRLGMVPYFDTPAR
jgi:hypothetical protein